MPTPFYHIAIAFDLLTEKNLIAGIKQKVAQERGPFLFGHTAPDVQVVSGAKREETHFFTLPLRRNPAPPWELLLHDFPELQSPIALQPDQAAFIAGYLCHLQGDWLWIRDVYFPIFGPECTWSSFSDRIYLHNVLRAYLDKKVMDSLPGSIDLYLKQAHPTNWLPFVNDQHLVEWRDFLASQLKPGALTKTIEVFSERQGINPENFRIIESEKAMDREVFVHIPRSKLDEFRSMLIKENIRLLTYYWHPSDHSPKS
jgi:hypothetical protein